MPDPYVARHFAKIKDPNTSPAVREDCIRRVADSFNWIPTPDSDLTPEVRERVLHHIEMLVTLMQAVDLSTPSKGA